MTKSTSCPAAERSGSRSGLQIRRKRLKLVRGTVEIVEVLIEVMGELSFGPPKTKNSVRTVALRGVG